MIKRELKYSVMGIILMIILFGAGVYANVIKLPITREIHTQSMADFTDDRILMGAAHNIFIGKVIKEIGNKDIGIGPETQFAVDVIYNVKGNLNGMVTVDQLGGYKNGVLYLVYDDDVVSSNENRGEALLESGMTYLFASRYNEKENWYTLISHPNGKKLISRDKKIDNDQLKGLAQNDERVVKLREAYKNEILLDADIKNNNTKNSYQSLYNN